MKKMNYTICTKMMSVEILKQAAMLKKYGIDKPSDFEISQLDKFGLTKHLKGVVATHDSVVLCNWELVLVAKATGVTDIEVTVIENLTEDEIPQVIAAKNVRNNLSKIALANLIVEYRDYLTRNEVGKLWAEEVPGESTDAKIGKIVGYSYGMINGYQAIYKYHPEFLDMMDAGEMNYTQAMQIIKDEKEPEPTADDLDNPITPKKSKAPKHNYAGELNMIPCVPMESIQIKYADGRIINVAIDGEKATGILFNNAIETTYTPKRENFNEGAEFHRLDSSDNKFSIELVIRAAA